MPRLKHDGVSAQLGKVVVGRVLDVASLELDGHQRILLALAQSGGWIQRFGARHDHFVHTPSVTTTKKDEITVIDQKK